jgi:hypothetical protein
MAPSRPAMFPDQLGLVILSFGAIAIGIAFLVKVLVS